MIAFNITVSVLYFVTGYIVMYNWDVVLPFWKTTHVLMYGLNYLL